jgi:predicted dehydrogenase
MWFLGEAEKVSAWITHRPIRHELAGRGVGLIKGVDHVVGTEREAAGASDKAVVPLRAEEVPDEWLIDSPVVAIWKYRNAEKYGSFEAITSYDILVRSKYTPEDEWVELTGSRGFIWVNRCTSMLLDRPPVVMYCDGVVTEFSDMESDWAASFIAGMHDFADALVQGRQPGLTGEEGKKVLQFCQAVELSAKEGRTVCPEEIN